MLVPTVSINQWFHCRHYVCAIILLLSSLLVGGRSLDKQSLATTTTDKQGE